MKLNNQFSLFVNQFWSKKHGHSLD